MAPEVRATGAVDMPETILIVDDEESVRRTFRDWLAASGLKVEVHAVADAESALRLANEHPIDLAVLDWNLGSGTDGLRLLEDLVEFHPDIVAILVTGFANQATPLDALRMGVRDYLDKNQDLNRETFLRAVRKQLDRILPAKRQRQFNRGTAAFRESVEKILPLVQSAAAFNDPVPLPDAVRNLFRFLIRPTGAADGVLLGRHVTADGAERLPRLRPDGKPLPPPHVPFTRSLAATVVSMHEPCAMTAADLTSARARSSCSRSRRAGRASWPPRSRWPGIARRPGTVRQARRVHAPRTAAGGAAADFGAELLRQALAERQTQRMLFDAVEAALQASEQVSTGEPTCGPRDAGRGKPPAGRAWTACEPDWTRTANAVVDAKTSLRAGRGGPRAGRPARAAAVRTHCVRLVRERADAARRDGSAASNG